MKRSVRNKTTINLQEVAEKSFTLLGKVLDESISLKNGEGIRRAFIHRHARNVYQLGMDTMCLLEDGRLDSSPIVVRAMLESLFKLVAAVKHSEAAVEILITEFEEERGRITKWLDPVSCAPAIKSLSEYVQTLRKDYKVTSTKNWNAFACAEAAGMVQEYRQDYFYYSGHTHATTGGIIMQEVAIGMGHILQTVLTIVIHAIAQAVQVLSSNSPQEHLDEATSLLKQILKAVKGGEFRKLDEIAESAATGENE